MNPSAKAADEAARSAQAALMRVMNTPKLDLP